MNIKFYYTLIGVFLIYCMGLRVYAMDEVMPVQACVMPRDIPLTHAVRAKFAECLGWQEDSSFPICRGFYQPDAITPLTDDGVHIVADDVSLYPNGRSRLHGHVELEQTQRIVTAETAYIYRDAKTNQVTRIELLGDVHYLEPDRLMIAKKATINPQDKSGHVEQVLYRLNTRHAGSVLPAWGRASLVERFANQDALLRQATYTTCSPKDSAWQIEANEIKLDHAASQGIAKRAVLRVRDWPVLYVPYLSFPTTKTRKSGFLMPMYGYSNVGGADLAWPYYWNIAPNYDATLVPHVYTRRGLMMGGDFRYLTEHSAGMVDGHILPGDHAFHQFVTDNQTAFPSLQGTSDDRWSFMWHEKTDFNENLHLNVNFQQVSDDYYLQDFSSNLAILTQNQLLRQGDLVYTTDHWLFSGMVQSYQTLHPINQSTISNIYERLPQLLARTSYGDLPFGANYTMLGEFDYFRWPSNELMQPEGPRYHLNPVLSLPYLKPGGYFTPSIQLVENYYDVHYNGTLTSNSFNRSIPRYNLDSGLFFERSLTWSNRAYTQTLEPRLNYLYVPYQNQTSVPVYDSAYMIFNQDQLFRMNRFSGFDRISDANQLAYALTSRWLQEDSGLEKASISLGQIRYFSNRRVQLCYQQQGGCVDSPLMLGYSSPLAGSSPIASRASYQMNAAWRVGGDYVWDPYTHATNNGNLNLHYQPAENQLIRVGYSYLVDGNLMQVANQGIQNNALHQATAAYAWPLSARWSGLGVYSYNISKRYDMMTFVGFQYESCCWAFRLMGGRTFKSLSPDNLTPQYNKNVYVQVLLKGLGSVASSDPASTINTYLPGYRNVF